MLAQVQPGEVEAEDLDPAHQVRDEAVGEAGAAVTAQAFGQPAQVRLQLARPGVGHAVVFRPRWLGRRAAAPQPLGLAQHGIVFDVGHGVAAPPLAQPGGVEPAGGGDPRLHEAALAPVGLGREVAGERGRQLRHGLGVGLERPAQLRRDVGALGRHAQLPLQLGQRVLVEGEGRLPVEAQRLLGDLGGDVGVPVAVAPDPGAEAQEGGHVDVLAGVGDDERLLHLPVQPRHQLPQRLLEVVQAVAHLVEDRGRAAPDLLGEPERGDLLPDAVAQLRALAGRPPRVVELLDEIGQPPQLEENRAPASLGGVGGEDGLDEARRQQLPHPVGSHSGGRRLGQRLLDRFSAGGGPRSRGVDPRSLIELGGLSGPPRPPLQHQLPPAQHAQPVVLLGQVDEVEVGREGPDEEPALVHPQTVGARPQPPASFPEIVAVLAGRRAHLLRAGAVLLDQGEAGLAFLLAQHVPEQAAERVDVRAQRVRLGFAGRHECILGN